MHSSERQLLSLLAEDTDGAVDPTVSEHVEKCTRCQTRLSKLSGASEWTAQLIVAARAQVTKLVSDQLDFDLENREKELVAIERRAKELRKQLEERKTAKPELLKMLVMLIDNPQVGLGIPPEWMQMLMRGQSHSYHEGFDIEDRFLVPQNAFMPPASGPNSSLGQRYELAKPDFETLAPAATPIPPAPPAPPETPETPERPIAP